MKKLIWILVCMLLVMTIPFVTVSAQKINIITDNSPPNIPIVTVPENVKIGELLEIKVVAIDPDGNDVYYRIKDFKGRIFVWYGPHPSGVEQFYGGLRIFFPGSYTIGAQARDIYNAESEWTYVQFNVTMPRNRAVNNPFLDFLQQHPILFPIPQY